MNEVSNRQTNQMTKQKEEFDKEMADAKGKVDQLTQVLNEARGTIVAMKREMNQIKKDLQLLLRQSTFDGKGPAASNGQSVPSGDETVFSLILRNQIYYNLLLMVSIVFEGVFDDVDAVGGEWKSKSYSMPRSCAEARSADPTLQSGNYYVDPDGTNVGDDPIYVYCDMQTGNIQSIQRTFSAADDESLSQSHRNLIKGTTLVSHDSEATIDVGNCNTPGCYSRAINYAGAAMTRQLATLSTSCRQFIRVRNQIKSLINKNEKLIGYTSIYLSSNGASSIHHMPSVRLIQRPV